MAEYGFGVPFKRKVVALAVRSDLLISAPGAFKAEHFGVVQGEPPPLQRLARIVERFADAYSNQRPGIATMEELVGD